MNVQRFYDGLPFSWQGKLPETIQNDCRWLASIVRNAAPFTDWWAKARIVQLAYPPPPGEVTQKLDGLPVYGGLKSEAEIAQALRSQADPAQYPVFSQAITENYVISTLNCWRVQQFSQAVSRNFEVYVDRRYPNTVLVTSTATVSLEVDRQLPANDRFRALFNVDELASIMQTANVKQVTLRTHGYSTPAPSFYWNFGQEAESLNTPDPTTQTRTLQDQHFYIGYDWPSEQPVTSPGLWIDYHKSPGIVIKFGLILGILAGIAGTLLYALLRLVVIPLVWLVGLIPTVSQASAWDNFISTLTLAVKWYWMIPTVFILWLLAFLLLRIVVYQRDRYRAIHYGAPDLSEFFWRLDKALSNPQNWLPTLPEAETEKFRQRQIKVNLIGHSMGALVMVNVLRILSDQFGKDDQKTLLPDSIAQYEESDHIGEHFKLDTLILASPDIPLEFLREGRNNYVRSAMRRCRRIYLMSSDRDIVLRYLATLVNWFSEPSIQMAGLRLGNIYLRKLAKTQDSLYRPYIRILIHSEATVQPTSSYELFRKFNYLDCSQMPGLNNAPLKLNLLNGLLIDLINTTFFLLGVNHLDVHGGYFQTNTTAFKIIKFLLTSNFLADEVIKAEIEQLIAGTPIRFLPSQPWEMPHQEQAQKILGE